MGSIAWGWRPIGAQFDAFRAAIRVLPAGARVIAFHDGEGFDPSQLHGPFHLYAHLPALAVIERDAYLPYLFKHAMNPVGAAPANRAIDTAVGNFIELRDMREGADPVRGEAMLGGPSVMGMRNYWGNWPGHFDHAVEIGFGAKPELPAPLLLLVEADFFRIHRIVP